MAAVPRAKVEEIVNAARASWRQQRESKLYSMRCLVELAQQIERSWDDESTRLALLAVFREALLDLGDSKHAELRWMGVLGRNMKRLDFGLAHFLNVALPLEREHTRSLQDFEFLTSTIEAADGLTAPDEVGAAVAQKLPLNVVVDNMRSAFNVGSLFRTAECLGVCKLYLCGYTATPNDHQVCCRCGPCTKTGSVASPACARA